MRAVLQADRAAFAASGFTENPTSVKLDAASAIASGHLLPSFTGREPPKHGWQHAGDASPMVEGDVAPAG